MYPYLLPEIFGHTIEMFDIIVVIGVFCMILYVSKRLEREDGFSHQQTNRLLILIGISLIATLFSAWFFDGIWHTIKNSELSFGSITFLYGLLGGVVTFLILLKHFYKDENKDVRKIMNTIITGVVLAHAIGRLGCTCAGCCFGIPTDSVFGVVFPHGHAHHMYGDQAVLPTQLMESMFLFVLFFVMTHWKKIKTYEIETYVIGYGVWRFMLEFLRGDDRGVFLHIIETEYNVYPTPSQALSFLLIVFGIVLLYLRKKRNN